MQEVKLVSLAHGKLSNLEIIRCPLLRERERESARRERQWGRGRERGQKGKMRENSFHYMLSRKSWKKIISMICKVISGVH